MGRHDYASDTDPLWVKFLDGLSEEEESAGSVLGSEIGLLTRAIDDLGADQHQLSSSLATLKRDFVRARQELEQEKDEEKKKKLVKNLQDNVKAAAATLPGVTKGILSIIDGVKNENGLAVAAGVLDIVGSVSAALGPYGAALSSLLSVVSMILNRYAPKPDDTLTKIEKTIRTIVAEKERDDVKTGYDALKKYSHIIDDIMTWETPDPEKMSGLIDDLNLMEGKTIWVLGAVRSWLGNPKNEGLDEWPDILRCLCDSYLQLFLANTNLSSYARNFTNYAKYNRSTSDDIVLHQDWVELAAGPKWVKEPGHDESKHSTEFKNWKKLVDAVWRKEEEVNEEKKLLVEFLKDIVPVVHKWGVYVVVLKHTEDSPDLHVTTGPCAFKKEGTFKKVRQNTGTMSVVPPRQGGGRQYDVWVLDYVNDRPLTYDKLDIISLRYQISKNVCDGAGSGITLNGYKTGRFSDVWPEPGTGTDGKFMLYLPHELPERAGTSDYILSQYQWDGDKKFTKTKWEISHVSKMSQVRLVGSVETFDDDPDRDGLEQRVKPASQGGTGVSIIYGALEGSNEIFVAFTDAKGDSWKVKSLPASYNGIAVDQRMLWVYGHEGFQCATHASVMSCLKDDGGRFDFRRSAPTPRWLGHGHPNQKRAGDTEALCSCEDGTLLVATSSRLAQTRYGIDFNKAATNPRDGLVLPYKDKWQQLNDYLPYIKQAQKVPIYGWRQFESLMKSVGVPVELTS